MDSFSGFEEISKQKSIMEAINEQLENLSKNREEWANMSYSEKLEILEEIYSIFSTDVAHEEWARESLAVQGYTLVLPEVLLAVEIIVTTSVIAKDLLSLIELYKSLVKSEKPLPIIKSRPFVNDTRDSITSTAAEVFPYSSSDSMGPDADWRVEVWVDGEEIKQSVPPRESRLCLLLGAGNQTVLAFCDALHYLFVESMTVAVKHHPIRGFSHKWMLKIFQPLIRRGFLASTVGGVKESKQLLTDERIDHVHMTGGKATHDMIVWGDLVKREKKILKVPITSELGAVTPCIVGPGDASAWSKAEIDHHAKYFATCLMSNNGCNCMGFQFLFLPSRGFPAEDFLEAVREVMEARPHSAPYYPGTRERYKRWVDHFGLDTEFVESSIKLPPGKSGNPLPWALSRVLYDDLIAGKHHVACQEEIFGPALAVCIVDNKDDVDYWNKVTDAANNHLFGSLSCTVVQHPSMDKNLAETVIQGLKFGSIGVNVWGGQAFGYPGGTWGAYPGEQLEAVQSGIGQLHNHFFLDHVEKTVTYAPFMSKNHIGSESPPTLKFAKFLASVIFSSAPAWRQFMHTSKWLLSWLTGATPTVVKEKVVGVVKDSEGCAVEEKAEGTSAVELSAAAERVAASKQKWLNLSTDHKARLLMQMLDAFSKIDHVAWARESLLAAGYDRLQPDPMVATEMIMNTRIIGKDLETLVDVYCSLRDTGKPPVVPFHQDGENFVIADVFPRTRADRSGPDRDWNVHVLMEGENAGKQSGPPTDKARVGLLLAAGNQGILAFADALHMLFVENMTVVVKHNPVRAYNHTYMQRIFAPLISQGFFVSVLGGIDESKALLASPLVDHVHITGGKSTHDAIVWGTPSATEQRVVNKLGKPITSELGSISPYIIGPGNWTEEELQHHARYAATVIMNNNGANCMAPQVLILPERDFPAEKFLQELKAVFKSRPHAPPYYPGTAGRHAAWLSALKDIPGVTTELIESEKELPPGKYGPPLPWIFSTCDYAVLSSSSIESHIVTQTEVFGPALAIMRVPYASDDIDEDREDNVKAPSSSTYWDKVSTFCNDKLFGSLAATIIQHPSSTNESIVQNLNYGSIGINSWGGQSYGYNCGTWGAFPGEKLEAVQSGIGIVRNFLFLQGVVKTVVRAPFVSVAHIGTAPSPPDLKTASLLCGVFSNSLNTARHNGGEDSFLVGNFRPISGEGVYSNLTVKGCIPKDLNGCFLRNGANQKFEPTGKMHMFDGDGMIHAFLFKEGQCSSYANSYLRTPRHKANEEKGCDLWGTFGDLTIKPGLETAKKLGWISLQQRVGILPSIPNTQAQNPSTATQLIGGCLYACVEVNSPFRVYVNPSTAEVLSGEHNDFHGQIPVFSAHSKVDGAGNVVYFAKGPRTENAETSAVNHYGIIDAEGNVKCRTDFRCGTGAPPAFLHDCFVTKDWSICIDHSLRADGTKLASGGYFQWETSRNVRLGLFPRQGAGPKADPEWYDIGFPGFVWHCVGSSQDGDVVTCWMPIFTEDYSDVPIHLATEPHSYLYKIVLNTMTKEVLEVKKFDDIGATERCSINDNCIGEVEPKYAYLMMRGPEEMYDGFVKFSLEEEKVVASVPYGQGRFGGEAFFQPRDDANSEDDGYLIDIIYDKNSDTSELCIWDAKVITENIEPVARIITPHRIPYGVHASFLTPKELETQWAKKGK